MSYETNPILNRIKLVKGWKNSSFPTKTLNYSRDLRVWFKLYLFLKVYLLLYGLRLLTYEVRLSEKFTKSVCLSLTKLPKKKKLTSKWKDHSFLKSFKSSFSVFDNKKGRFLLYLDVQTLKKKVLSFLNNTNQKLISPSWNAKPQTGSWINISFWIGQQRKRAKLDYQLIWKKKVLRSQHWQSKRATVFAKKEKEKKHSSFFWNKKERTVFSLLAKMQKKVAFSETYFHFVWKQALVARNLTLFRLMAPLANQLQQQQDLLRRLSKLYLFLRQKNAQNSTQAQTLNSWHMRLKKKKIQLSQLHLLTQQTDSSAKKILFFSPQKQKLLFAHHQILVRSQQGLTFEKRSSLFKRHLSKNRIQILVAQKPFKKRQPKSFDLRSKKIQQRLQLAKTDLQHIWQKKQQQSRVSWQELPKTTLLQKPYSFSFQDHLFWIRLAQKKRLIQKRQKQRLTQKTKKKKKHKSRYRTQNSGFYRYSLQENYRKFLTLATHVKLKYLLQDLISQYFALSVGIKISWPLLQFKNLKFYRLVFPAYKMKFASKVETPLLQQPHLPEFRSKKYIYVGQTTAHVKFQTLVGVLNAKNVLQKGRGTDLLSAKMLHFLNLEKKKMSQKNTYLAWKRKQLDIQSQERLAFVSRTPFISGLLTTLTLFGKYLDPQPLADHLAKLIGQTKKHAQLLKLIETVLRTFPLQRGLGYRIALIGRINGANKSKTLYLRKLKRNRPRQTFAKKVNFAVAHARALIGAFAVKIWVYL